MIEIIKSGGPVMYPLIICSFISLMVIIERAIFWIRIEMQRDKSLVFKVLDLSREGEWEQVRETVGSSKNYIVKILISGIVHRDFSMGKAMEAAAADEVKKMERYMGILDTIIMVAPLLGILGTVVGIIFSFDMLGESGIGDPRAVTGGIAQALISTASGLTIAITTVLPFNYFTSRIDSAAQAIEKYATSLEIVYEKLALEEGGRSQV